MRNCDRGHVLTLLRLAERRGAGRARRRARAERRCARALNPGVHVCLVVVTDEDEAIDALERAREELQVDVVNIAVAGKDEETRLAILWERYTLCKPTVRGLDAARDC